MVIDDKFYVGGARDRQIIRMVRGIRRFHRVKYVPGVFVITLPLFDPSPSMPTRALPDL